MAQISSGPLNSPYRRAFDRLPSAIQSSLWDHGYSRIQPDGELLKDSLEVEQAEQGISIWETSLGKGIVEKCIEYNDPTNELSAPNGLSPLPQLSSIISNLLMDLQRKTITFCNKELLAMNCILCC
jgi:hypothetical protein